jgi:hypothetical protein
VYVSGQANAGVKTIAINLPNDEVVQLQKGARRLQLKNAVRAKFDRSSSRSRVSSSSPTSCRA